MSTLSYLMRDCLGRVYDYFPSSLHFGYVNLEQVVAGTCAHCGCNPCIVRFFQLDIDEEDIQGVSQSSCIFFPFALLGDLWEGYLEGFCARDGTDTVPRTLYETRLKKCLSFIRHVVHPALTVVHALHGCDFQPGFVRKVFLAMSQEDLEEEFTEKVWTVGHYLEQYRDKEYIYGEMLLFFIMNQAHNLDMVYWSAVPLEEWFHMVEEVRATGSFQRLLRQANKCMRMHSITEFGRLEGVDEMPSCTGEAGHIDMLLDRSLVAAHPAVAVAPWQFCADSVVFSGQTALTKTFIRCIEEVYPYCGVIKEGWDFYSPGALAVDCGVRGCDDECPHCLDQRAPDGATDIETGTWSAQLKYRRAMGLEQSHSEIIIALSEWLGRMGGPEARLGRINGFVRCGHNWKVGEGADPEEEYVAQYNAVRAGLRSILPEGEVQVGMSTLSDLTFRGDAKAMVQFSCAPTTRCCGYGRGPACNEMGVMLR